MASMATADRVQIRAELITCPHFGTRWGGEVCVVQKAGSKLQTATGKAPESGCGACLGPCFGSWQEGKVR